MDKYSLTAFTLPKPDVRLVVHNQTVYKIKLRCRSSRLKDESIEERYISFIRPGKAGGGG